MSASVNRKLTAYQSIPTFTRNLNVYSCSGMDRLEDLLDAMRTWNLHGSANRLEDWRAKMQKHIEAEHQEYTWEIPND